MRGWGPTSVGPWRPRPDDTPCFCRFQAAWPPAGRDGLSSRSHQSRFLRGPRSKRGEEPDVRFDDTAAASCDSSVHSMGVHSACVRTNAPCVTPVGAPGPSDFVGSTEPKKKTVSPCTEMSRPSSSNFCWTLKPMVCFRTCGAVPPRASAETSQARLGLFLSLTKACAPHSGGGSNVFASRPAAATLTRLEDDVRHNGRVGKHHNDSVELNCNLFPVPVERATEVRVHLRGGGGRRWEHTDLL